MESTGLLSKDNVESRVKVFKKQLLQEILSENYQPGQKLMSGHEFGKKYGVSYVTVHKCLKQLADEGYLLRQNGLGTFIAERKDRIRLKKVGVPLRIARNPFFPSVYEEISRYTNLKGIQLEFGSGENELAFIDRMSKENCDALLRFPGPTMYENEIYDKLEKNGIRTVILNDWWRDGGGRFPSVRSNEEQAAGEMLEHFNNNGCRNIALVQEVFYAERTGLYRALHRFHHLHDLPINHENFIYMADFNTNYGNLLAYLQNKNFDALFFSYDMIAEKFITYTKTHDPEFLNRCAICGFDDIPSSEENGLTTIRHDISSLIKEAFRILGSGEYEKTPVSLVPAKCIFRASTLGNN